MADPNYQPQQKNLYGFSNGIPGIVGGSSTPLLQQARVPATSAPSASSSAASGEVPGEGFGSTISPDASAFLDAETSAARDERMGKVSEMLGKGISLGSGMLGIPGGSLIAGYGTGNGLGAKLGGTLEGFFGSMGDMLSGRSEGNRQNSNVDGTGMTANEKSARAGYGNSLGFGAPSAPAVGIEGDSNAFGSGSTASTSGIEGDSNAFGGAPTAADQAGDGGGSSSGGGLGPQGSNDGLGDGNAFAAGGLITPASAPPMAMPPAGGAPPTGRPGLAPPGAPSGPADPRMVDAQVRDLLRNKPEVVNKLQMMAQQAIQSGETTPEQIQQLGQIARVCLQNPAMYPKLVQMAEQRGIAPPGSMPATYNESAVKRLILLAAVVSQSPLGQPGTPGQEGGAPIEMDDGEGDGEDGGEDVMAMRKGGMIRGRGTGTSDSIPGVNTSNGGRVKVSNGEYIIPAKVVAIKGKEFFDNLLRKYSDVSGGRG